MAQRRVVVTGMGVITPLGHTVRELFRAQIEGRSGVGPITSFDARGFPTTFAAMVAELPDLVEEINSLLRLLCFSQGEVGRA